MNDEQAKNCPESFRTPAAGLVTIEAAIKGSEGMPGAPPLPRFNMVAYTGAAMRLDGFYHPVVIDLASASVEKQNVPVPMNHDPERMLGHTDSIKISDGKITATGVLSHGGELTDRVAGSAKNGFPWQASIGADAKKYEFIAKDHYCEVNGRKQDGPCVVARGAKIREITITAMGADADTETHISARKKELEMDELTTYAETQGYRPLPELPAEVQARIKAEFEAKKKPAPPPTPPPPPAPPAPPAPPPEPNGIEAARKAWKVENARITGIHKETQADPGREATVEGKKVVIRDEAIGEGWTVEATALAFLRAGRTLGPGIGTPAQEELHSGGDMFRCRVIEAGILRAGGYVFGSQDSPRHPERNDAKHYTDRVFEVCDRAFPGGKVGLQQTLVAMAKLGGYTGTDVVSDGNLSQIIAAAFRPQMRASDGFDTASLSNLLANVQNKFLLQGYMAVESTWRQITAVRGVKDFKPSSNINFFGDFVFLLLGPTGEIQHAKPNDEAFSNQVTTYARISQIPRTMIINDDLAALTTIPQKMGRGAGIAINKLFWTTYLTAKSTFYTTGNNNYISGSTTNLQSSSLQTLWQTIKKQTDPDGNPLGADPAILLVPPELAVTATELLFAPTLVGTGSTSPSKQPNLNVFGTMTAMQKKPIDLAISTYMSNTSYTGYSTTSFDLLCDPGLFPVIECVFLNGQESPTVRVVTPDANLLGITMQGFWDIGVGTQNFRGGASSKGSA
jgi:hypothetical protein